MANKKNTGARGSSYREDKRGGMFKISAHKGGDWQNDFLQSSDNVQDNVTLSKNY